ncbi:ABC transporter permease [Trujillonella humicola]|uniref:ABC transporter permease n=1 Tax=Trujillonella humicola TaxID=3383699 RepID=UPI003906A93C
MVDVLFVVSAVAVGMIYALAAFGLIVTFRVTGVFNLAFGYQASLAAFLYWQLTVGWGLSAPLSAALVVCVASPLMGSAIQATLFRRSRDMLTAIIVTLGLGIGIGGLIQVIWRTSEVRSVPSVFGAGTVDLFGTTVTVNELGVIVVTVAIGVGLRLLMVTSRLGLRMQAVVDNPDLAAVTGIPYGRVNAIAWSLGTALASLSGILLAPLLNLDVAILSVLVVYAFAVAVLGRLQSMPLALGGALLLSFAQTWADRNPDVFAFLSGSARDILPFVLLVVALLMQPAGRRGLRVVGGGLQRVARERGNDSPVPAMVAVVVLALLAVTLGSFWVYVAIGGVVYALVALSINLLTGASAQISLCQVAFMGIGAVTAGKLLESGASWFLAALGGVVVAGLAGLVVAVCAFRLQGLFLTLLTLAFAYAVMQLVFENKEIIGPAGVRVGRPEAGPLSFADDRAYLALVVVVLLAAMWFVARALRGPWGRALAILTAGDDVAEVAGLGVRGWKIRVFVLSAALAGLGGVLFAGAQDLVSAQSFTPLASLTILALAVVGGVTRSFGPVIAGFLVAASSPILSSVIDNPGNVSLILFGLMTMQVAVMFPAGYAGMIPSGRRRRGSSESPPPTAPGGPAAGALVPTGAEVAR